MSKIETFDLKQLIGNFFALKQHNHGNILDGGTINTDILSNETLNKILITDSNNKIKTLNKLPLDKVTHQDISGKANIADLETVATSGSYNDLKDIPSNFTPSAHTHQSTDITIVTLTEEKDANNETIPINLDKLINTGTYAISSVVYGRIVATSKPHTYNYSCIIKVERYGSLICQTLYALNGAADKEWIYYRSFKVENDTLSSTYTEDGSTNGWIKIYTSKDIDSSLSSTSTNPIQNKVIYAELNDYLKKEEFIAGTGLYKQSDNNNTVLNISEQGVGTNQLANQSVTSDKIAQAAITGQHINTSVIGTNSNQLARGNHTHSNHTWKLITSSTNLDYDYLTTGWWLCDTNIAYTILGTPWTSPNKAFFLDVYYVESEDTYLIQNIYTCDGIENWTRSRVNNQWQEWQKKPLINKNDEIILNSGTGLSKSGTTLNHSNSVTAQPSAALKSIKFDAQGHITGVDDPHLKDIKFDKTISSTSVDYTSINYNDFISTQTISIQLISGTSNRQNGPDSATASKYGGLLIVQQLYNNHVNQTFYRYGSSGEIWYRSYNANNTGTWTSWIRIDGQNKVDTISGKGLSTNDYTTEEKNKLSDIATEANKTIVDSSLDSTSTNPVQNKVIKEALENVTGDLLEYIVNNYDQYDWE